MKKIIIAVHGLGNKPARPLLKKWWLKAVHEGLRGIDRPRLHVPFEFVYWADILYPLPLDPREKHEKAPLFLKEPYIQRRNPPDTGDMSLRGKIYHYIDEHLDPVFLNEDMSINFSGVTDRIIHHFFSDLEKYYTNSCASLKETECSAKTAIQNRLYQTLKKHRQHEILLIAHSMGSIIAFDVLRRFADELNIHTLVTIGSPLGLPVIKARIFAAQKAANPDITEPHAPACVHANWYNLSDPEDKVAVDRGLADDFGANANGVRAIDKTIYNDFEADGKRNPHKSFGYLRTPEMAEILDTFLEGAEEGVLGRIYEQLKNLFHIYRE